MPLMPLVPLVALVPLVLLAACGSADPVDETHRGELTSTDPRHPSDQSSYDEYTFTADKGYTVDVEMSSESFDTFIHIIGPEGEDWQNDDRAGDDWNSRRQFVATSSGTYRVWANSHRPGAEGPYQLQIRTTEAN